MAAERRGPLDRDLLARVPALRRHLVLSAVCAALAALLVVAQAEIIARTLVSIIEGRSESLAGPVVALLIVALVRGSVTGVVEWSGAAAMRRTRVDLRESVLDHSAADSQREDAGLAAREMTVATSGVDGLDAYVRDYLPALTTAVTVPLAAALRILSVDWVSAAIVVVTVPLIPVFMVLIGQLTERRSRRQWAMLQRLAGHFLDVLEGLPTLRLFGRARAQADSVARVSEDYRQATVSTLRVAFLSALALELLATLSVAVIAVSVGLRLADGDMGLEAGLVVLLLAPECYLPLRRVGGAFHAAEAGHDAADDLRAVLDRPVLPAGGRPLDEGGDISIRDLRVERRNVWTGALDLDLEPGTVTVVFGPSGVGKSTLLSALRGRLAGRQGTVTVEGVDLSEIDPVAWAGHIVVMPQRPEPLSNTVSAEVRGGTTATGQAIAEALDQVGLAGLGHRDPATLSGGQLRRVQVARAIVAVRHGTARLVLADEPTAQLDETSAAVVRTALMRLALDARATVVVASHDPGWTTAADQLVQLDPAYGLTRSFDESAAEPDQLQADVTSPDPGVVVPDVAVPDVAVTDARRRWGAVRDAVRPVRSRLALATAFAVLADVCTLGLAGAAAWLIVRASEQPPLAALAVAVTGIRAFGIGKGVLRYAERLASHDAGFRVLGRVRSQLVGRLAEVAPLPGWERGDIVRRTVDDVDRLLDLVVRVVVPWTSVAITSAAAVVIMAVLDPGAGAVMAVALVAVAIVAPLLVIRHERRVGSSALAARGRLAARVLAATERVDLLIGAGLWPSARDRIAEATGEVERLERARALERLTSRALASAAPAVVVAAMVAVVGTGSGLSAPVIGVLVLWPLAVVEAATSVIDGARTVPELAAAADRVDQLLSVEPARGDSGPLEIGERPRLHLLDLEAQWPGSAHTLGPYDLEAPAGGRAVVVGPSGSGKSTLAAAMVRFCPIVGGRYDLDGSDAVRAEGDEVRQAVLWIDQHPWIGDSSVRENLKIADPAASDERLVEALGVVELGSWLTALPSGLDTMVGRGGVAMSGGEAHRLGIARALLAAHAVVVLDEPVSHLDRAMGERVMTAVDEQLRDRTLVVLGHQRASIGAVSTLTLDTEPATTVR